MNPVPTTIAAAWAEELQGRLEDRKIAPDDAEIAVAENLFYAGVVAMTTMVAAVLDHSSSNQAVYDFLRRILDETTEYLEVTDADSA